MAARQETIVAKALGLRLSLSHFNHRRAWNIPGNRSAPQGDARASYADLTNDGAAGRRHCPRAGRGSAARLSPADTREELLRGVLFGVTWEDAVLEKFLSSLACSKKTGSDIAQLNH